MTNQGTSDERADGDKLREAIQALEERDLPTARRLLKQVVANSPPPSDYEYRYEDSEGEVIKFWDLDEFIYYVTYRKQATDKSEEESLGSITWKASVYPRAHFYLAIVDAEEGNLESALSHVEASLELEPDQPLSFCEMATIYSKKGQYEQALRCCDRALHLRPHMTAAVRARALRGKAFALIELGWLDQAETYLQESLRYEPTSQVARQEMAYIAHLRAGGSRLPSAIKVFEGEPDVCAICGRELSDEHRVVYIEGRVVYVCSRCLKRKTKRWWEFWK